MSAFWARHQTIIVALAASFAALALLFVLWTPVCFWTIGSPGACRQMTCELITMRRPHAEPAWCEAWFELFSEPPADRQPGAAVPPVE